jgi:hypothetical protein
MSVALKAAACKRYGGRTSGSLWVESRHRRLTTAGHQRADWRWSKLEGGTLAPGESASDGPVKSMTDTAVADRLDHQEGSQLYGTSHPSPPTG